VAEEHGLSLMFDLATYECQCSQATARALESSGHDEDAAVGKDVFVNHVAELRWET
jgi:hypothetical protein